MSFRRSVEKFGWGGEKRPPCEIGLPPSKCPGERSDVHQGPSGLNTKSYFSRGEFTGVECTGTLDRGCQHCKLSPRVNKEHGIAECESSF